MTVNPIISARTLFSRIALKDIFATDKMISPFREDFNFTKLRIYEVWRKYYPRENFTNLQCPNLCYNEVCFKGTAQYRKPCLKRPIRKKTKNGFQERISLNACQKYCRMLQREHSAILSTFMKLPFVTKIFVLSIFE